MAAITRTKKEQANVSWTTSVFNLSLLRPEADTGTV